MSSPSLRIPLIVLFLGLFIVVLLFVQPTSNPVAYSQSGYPAPSATAIPTATARPASTTVATATTLVATTTQPTAAIATAFIPATPTPLPIVRLAPTRTIPTATPLAEVVAQGSTRSCAVGEPIEVRGNAPSRAALLAFFGQRAVGGGSARGDGSFNIVLVIGPEQPGSYPISVRVRGSWEEVANMTCVVPLLLPTPRVVR